MDKEFKNSVMEVKKDFERRGIRMSHAQMISELIKYRPAREGMTGMDEITFLRDYFGLYNMSVYEMQNLRDMVVLMFSGWIDHADSDAVWDLSQGMMSITAVIDDMMVLKRNHNEC